MSRRGARRARVKPVLGFRNTAVTATGTTPPTVTLTGSPASGYSFNIQITTGGSVGTAVFKWSSNGGLTFTTGVATAATVLLGITGVTANFAAGTYATDNVYVAGALQL